MSESIPAESSLVDFSTLYEKRIFPQHPTSLSNNDGQLCLSPSKNAYPNGEAFLEFTLSSGVGGSLFIFFRSRMSPSDQENGLYAGQSDHLLARRKESASSRTPEVGAVLTYFVSNKVALVSLCHIVSDPGLLSNARHNILKSATPDEQLGWKSTYLPWQTTALALVDEP
ncbi:hypothetical protein Tco_0079449 [Tanacetum coccineum]